MDKLIEQSIRKQTDTKIRKRSLRPHNIDQTTLETITNEDLSKIKFATRLALYNEMLISDSLLADKIAKAKINGDNYVILFHVSFDMSDGYEIDRKDLVCNFYPEGKETIYKILTNMLPTGYKVCIDESKFLTYYMFQLYIVWDDLSFWDRLDLWIDTAITKRLMESDQISYY